MGDGLEERLMEDARSGALCACQRALIEKGHRDAVLPRLHQGVREDSSGEMEAQLSARPSGSPLDTVLVAV